MTGRPVNRIDNKMPARAMQTFQIAAPTKTHFRPASCEEVECPNYLRGWRMRIDLNTELGQKQAYYIKHHAGRSYKVTGQADGVVDLEFAPNQPCFDQHKVRRNDIPELYRVKGGDHRGNPLRTLTRTHKSPETWVEEFQENQDRLKRAKEKG